MALIRAGDVTMGSYDGEEDEQPVHRVWLDAFYLDLHEVTNADYKRFLDARGRKPPYNWVGGLYPADSAAQPVRLVTWDDAADYARWAGKRLPTEAEWEKAARGGLINKNYPWGDEIKPTNARYSSRLGPVPVGRFAANGYGLFDMAGNIWEWVADWYDAEYYYSSPDRNPRGPSVGAYHVLRGGSWYDHPAYLRCAFRNWAKAGARSLTVGFRCAQSIPGSSTEESSQHPLPLTHLKIGEHAPDGTLLDQDSQPVRLGDLWRARNLVLFFCGRAFTGGTKREVEAYKVDSVFFDGADVGLVGVTEEHPAVNKKLEGETGIKYPLLSDPDGALARTYGCFLERWAVSRRSTFVIDRNGIIRYVQQGAAAADSEQALDFSLKAFVHHSVPVAAAH
jgi:peroxiredoxin